jgi:hypothetical protein
MAWPALHNGGSSRRRRRFPAADRRDLRELPPGCRRGASGIAYDGPATPSPRRTVIEAVHPSTQCRTLSDSALTPNCLDFGTQPA